MSDTSWRVLPHDPLEQLGDRLYRVEGDLPNLKIRRQMIVLVEDDGLLLHNPMCLDEATMARLLELGQPTWVIVPSGFHRMDIARYRERFPGITVLAPRAGRARIEKVARVDLVYEEFDGTSHARIEYVAGVGDREGVLVVDTEEGVTLVFNDVLMNIPHFGGVMGRIYRWIGDSGRPTVTRLARLAIVRDRRALARHLRTLADTPRLVRVVPGHGTPISDDPAGALRQVADRLDPPRT
ncbi:MAG: hypothetical protein D6705_05735 [Deltaproteobacteria bacterium]|nr:MAG: hypothetical protein D6705_05735 [Deltaproteobacteria bacterium]